MAARRDNAYFKELVVLSCDHGEAADADLAVKFHKCLRSFKIEKVQYINPTGLAAHNSNHAVISLKKGSTIMASWNTDGDAVGAEGAIAADTFINLTLSATPANLTAAADDVLTLSVDESGTTTVPPGKLVVFGRYV